MLFDAEMLSTDNRYSLFSNGEVFSVQENLSDYIIVI